MAHKILLHQPLLFPEMEPPTEVVNLRKERYDVYIGRAGKGKDGYFGNPFTLEDDNPHDRQLILNQYREWFLHKIDTDPVFRDRVLGLKGKRLGCFCKPKICHGDIIKEWLDSQVNYQVNEQGETNER